MASTSPARRRMSGSGWWGRDEATVDPGVRLYWYDEASGGNISSVRLGRCTWTDSGIRCSCIAERLCEIPGRERLKMYPVCLCHTSEPDDVVHETALLIEEAERRTGEHQE